MRKKLLLLFLLLGISVFAQKEMLPPCLSDQIMDEILKNPEAKERLDLMEKQIGSFQNYQQRTTTMPVITIPIVVYIVHGGGTENITDIQVISQIQALNEYFQEYGLKFCLATRAGSSSSIPVNSGNIQNVPGIVHIQNATLSNRTVNNLYELENLVHSSISRGRYLRIWVIKTFETNSIKGFGSFPNSYGFDGIVMKYNVFGKLTPSNPNDPCSSCVLDPSLIQGKTLVHEVGHYFGLYHTFHQSCTEGTNCNTKGDNVCDTPPVYQANYGCGPVDSCSADSLADDTTNYMDYGNECSDHFTPGQLQRMMGTLNTQRASLFANSNLIYTGPCGVAAPLSAAFKATHYTVCAGTNTNINFTADAQSGLQYSWDFGDGQTYQSTSNLAAHVYNTATNSPFTVKLLVTKTATGEQVAFQDKIFVTTCPAPADKANSRWYVGANSMLNFNSGLASFETFNTNVNNANVTANQNDANGNLMFYTDKKYIYDAAYSTTNPANALISGGAYHGNSVLILPKPVTSGSPTQYYLFTNTYNGYNDDGFRYSVVSSSGVLSSTVEVAVTTPSGFRVNNANNSLLSGAGITAIAKSDGYWVISAFVKETESASVYLVVYNLTATGLSYRSSTKLCLGWHGDLNGVSIKASPDGNRVAYCGTFFDSFVLDFNKFSGAFISSPLSTTDKAMSFDFLDNISDFTFSPDSKLLYACNRSGIWQCNLSTVNPSQTYVKVGQLSGYLEENFGSFRSIRTAPDGRIYIAPEWQANFPPVINQQELGVIHNPNVLATVNTPNTCNFSVHGPKNASSQLTGCLPNMVDAKTATVYNNTVSYFPVGCGKYRFFPNISGATPSTLYRWEVYLGAATTPLTTTNTNVFTRTFTQQGTYKIVLKNSAGTITHYTISNLVIALPDPPVILGNDSACSINDQASHNSVVLQTGDTALWSIIGGSGIISGANIGDEVTVGWESLPGTIKVVVTNSEGCVTESTKIIQSSCAENGANGNVNVVKKHSDKFYIGGNFTQYNGETSNKIARLNQDLSLDPNFNAGASTDASISTMAIQHDGKIWIGGNFTTVNGNAKNGIARLLTNGTYDNTLAGIGVNGYVNSLEYQANWKVVVGGNFQDYNGIPAHGLIRLELNGSKDVNFNSTVIPINWTVQALAVQSDYKIIVILYDDISSNPQIYRLNSDGTLDNTFADFSPTFGDLTTLKILSNGKIIVGGKFMHLTSNHEYRDIVRLNSDGSFDTTFLPDQVIDTGNAPGIVTIEELEDNKILIGGGFTTIGVTEIKGIARLTAGGLLDTTFNPGMGFTRNVRFPRAGIGSVHSMVVVDNTKVVTGGFFDKYNGITVNNITRIDLTTTSVIGRPSNTNPDDTKRGQDLLIYPNPASDYLIVFNGDIKADLIEIYSVTGQLIKRMPLFNGENQISISEFSKGIYSCKIFQDGQVLKTEKLVKN